MLAPNQNTSIVPTPHDISTVGQKKSFILTALTNESFHSLQSSRNTPEVSCSAARLCTTLIPEKSSCVNALRFDDFFLCSCHLFLETVDMKKKVTSINGSVA